MTYLVTYIIMQNILWHSAWLWVSLINWQNDLQSFNYIHIYNGVFCVIKVTVVYHSFYVTKSKKPWKLATCNLKHWQATTLWTISKFLNACLLAIRLHTLDNNSLPLKPFSMHVAKTYSTNQLQLKCVLRIACAQKRI